MKFLGFLFVLFDLSVFLAGAFFWYCMIQNPHIVPWYTGWFVGAGTIMALGEALNNAKRTFED